MVFVLLQNAAKSWGLNQKVAGVKHQVRTTTPCKKKITNTFGGFIPETSPTPTPENKTTTNPQNREKNKKSKSKKYKQKLKAKSSTLCSIHR